MFGVRYFPFCVSFLTFESNPNNSPYLSPQQFAVALKLISLAQNNQQPTLQNLQNLINSGESLFLSHLRPFSFA